VPADSAHQQQRENLPEDPLTPIPMSQRMLVHQQKLEEIRKKLIPRTVGGVLNTDVKTYNNDISLIFEDIENIKKPEDKDDLLNYISSADNFNLKLQEIMFQLQTALYAWDLSNDVDRSPTQRIEARGEYIRLVGSCYKLLEDALKYFESSKEAQQGTN
jgi:hypothetical protein